MKLHIESVVGQEYIVECNNWEVDHGTINAWDEKGAIIFCIKEWNYVGTQPFDSLLAKEIPETMKPIFKRDY